MRTISLLFLAGVAVAQAPSVQPVGTMSQLMINIIYPTSDDLFYIVRGAPKDEKGWNALKSSALTLAESANLLMMPGRARDQDKWIKDARMLLDVGTAAFKAAMAKDAPAIEALNEQLEAACVTCHQDYRPTYRKRR